MNWSFLFAILVALATFGSCSIDSEFREKLFGARPQIDLNAAGKLASVQHRFGYRFGLDNLPIQEIANKGGEVMGVVQTNGQFAPVGPGVIAFNPYKDCSSLAFATTIEGLQFEKVLNARDGLVKLHGHIGRANGGLATIRSTFAFTAINIFEQITSHNVNVCKTILFFKQCRNEVHRHARGLTHDEVNLIVQGSIWITLEIAGIAFNGFDLQESLMSKESSLAAFDTSNISSIKRLRGVREENIINAIKASIGDGFTQHYSTLSKESLQSGEITASFDNKAGKHKVKVSKQESGEFDIFITTV